MFRFDKTIKNFYKSDGEFGVPKGYSNGELNQHFMARVKNNNRKDAVDVWYRCTVYEVMGNLTESNYTFNLSPYFTISTENFLETYDKNKDCVHINVKGISKIKEKDYIFGINLDDEYSPKVVEIMETDFSDSYRIDMFFREFSTRTLTNDVIKESWFRSMFSETIALEVLSNGRKLNGED